MEGLLTYRDWIGGALGLTLAGLLFYVMVLWRETDDRRRYWFSLFFGLKMLCVVGYAFLYHFHYGYGDVYQYFRSGVDLNGLLWSQPNDFVRFVLYPARDLPDSISWIRWNWKIYTPSTKWVDILASVLILPGYPSYLWVAFVMGSLSFWGTYQIYKAFCASFSERGFLSLVAFFGVPSFVFWSSGLGKESFILFLLGAAVWAFRTGRLLWMVLVIPLGLYMVMQMKFYILSLVAVSFVLTSLISLLVNSWRRSWDWLILLTVGVLILLPGLGSRVADFREDLVRGMVATQVVQVQESALNEGSGYALTSDWMRDVPSFLRGSVEAVVVTYLRPFPWECSKAIHYLQLLENALLILCFLWMMRSGGWVRPLSRNEFLMLLWCVLFAVVVGLTSFNFGTLSRYRIFVMPVLVGLLWTRRR